MKLGYKYGSRHVDYIKGKGGLEAWTIHHDGPYDKTSIMHYATWHDGNDRCKRQIWESCPLLAWKNSEDRHWPHVLPLDLGSRVSWISSG
jgi:hypothetical protein